LLKNFETSLPKFWQVKTSGGALAPTVAYAENFHGGGLFSHVWCHLYLVDVVCDVII